MIRDEKVYRMHHEADDWKLAGAFGLGVICCALAFALAAVLAMTLPGA